MEYLNFQTETPPTRRPPPEGLWVVNGTARRTLSPTADPSHIGMAELSSVGGISPRENGPSRAGEAVRESSRPPSDPSIIGQNGRIDDDQRHGKEEEEEEEEGQTTVV
jgi:hypothetical protein